MADRRLERQSVAVLLSLALCASACSTKIKGTIPAPAAITAAATFRAGAASVDLTPIPGIPMAGYSMGGKVARGAWVHLRARALYLEDPGGEALALVACDLDQIPNGLSDRVAELLYKETSVKHLGREQIVLGGSHTHHGPGNFFSEGMYNSFATPRGGFDEELFEFLAHRIADAIAGAYAAAVPAILRTAPPPGIGPNDRLPCVFRNRSLPAFERNPEDEVATLRAANPCPGTCCPTRCPDKAACESVHTAIDYFSVVDAATPAHVIGIAVFLAGHATVLSPNNELYSPDYFGVTSTLLETGKAGCLGGTPPPVVAVFNGAEGDVSPAWEAGKRDRRNVLDIAEDIAARVCAILPSAQDRPNADIAYRWGELTELDDQWVDDPFDRRTGWQQRTAAKARVGAAALGGAEDGRTILHDMGFVEGLRGPVRDDQGIKNSFEIQLLGGRSSVGAIAAAGDPPPEKAPMGVYSLDNKLVLATLPGEFTTMLGDRIRGYIAGKLSFTPDRVVLMGLANGHVSYVTTPEEFEAQHYEGAQNIYGAATGPLLAVELGALANNVGTLGPPPTPRSYRYDAGKAKRWRVRAAAGPPYEANEGVGDVVEDLVTRKPKADFPTFCFRDSVPRLSQVKPGACERTMPDVRIETGGGAPVSIGGVPQDSSRGLDVVTVLTGVGSDMTTGKHATEWCAIWMAPAATPPAQYRFHVERIRGAALTSALFQAGGANPPIFYSPTAAPLRPDRRDSIFCESALEFLGLCPEPQTCELP